MYSSTFDPGLSTSCKIIICFFTLSTTSSMYLRWEARRSSSSCKMMLTSVSWSWQICSSPCDKPSLSSSSSCSSILMSWISFFAQISCLAGCIALLLRIANGFFLSTLYGFSSWLRLPIILWMHWMFSLSSSSLFILLCDLDSVTDVRTVLRRLALVVPLSLRPWRDAGSDIGSHLRWLESVCLKTCNFVDDCTWSDRHAFLSFECNRQVFDANCVCLERAELFDFFLGRADAVSGQHQRVGFVSVFSLEFFDSVSVSQRVQRVLAAWCTWRHVCNHDSFTIANKRIF